MSFYVPSHISSIAEAYVNHNSRLGRQAIKQRSIFYSLS
ncbi:Uncharacterised protein [Serratia fonticola]|nr:Uncharacterised protein [Serratia fonticola]